MHFDAGKITSEYERLLANFTRWAGGEDNNRAAVVIGSRARMHGRNA
jgi:hypothetical protein